MESSDVKIIVAAHKDYRMPDDEIYFPLQVGAEGKEALPFAGDNTGDNISEKNYSYCELTGLYWAWKNLDCKYLGLVHYRRYFKGRRHSKDKLGRILTESEAEGLLASCSVLLPKKRHYYIETNRSQYLHAHHAVGLTETENVIREFYPDYSESFDKIMKRRSGHRFNMFLMEKKLSDAYCAWLFDILGKVEERIDISSWDRSEQRVFGYLGERLLDVWLDKNHIEFQDIPYIFMEKQSWFKKIFRFLKRKFMPAKRGE